MTDFETEVRDFLGEGHERVTDHQIELLRDEFPSASPFGIARLLTEVLRLPVPPHSAQERDQ